MDETRLPAWLVVGADVVHPTHGTGTVAHVGELRRLPTVWVDFDYGERRPLDLRYALDLLHRTPPGTRRTKPRPAVRCDLCGHRPVVLREGPHQYCHAHRPREDRSEEPDL